MKNLALLIILVCVGSVSEVLREFPTVPPRVAYLADLAIASFGIVVIAKLILTQRWRLVPLRYFLAFFGFSYAVVSGTVLNDVSPETTFAGIRMYFKYVPLFLAPFAFDFTSRDLRLQFGGIIALALIQIPFAFWQRFVEHVGAGESSGDLITGTLGNSGSLSIFQVGTIVAIAALHVAGKISRVWTLLLCGLLVLPTTINETKATPIFLLAGAIGVLFANRGRLRASQIAVIGSTTVALVVGFVMVYDSLYAERVGSPKFVEQMTSKKYIVDNYNLTGVRARSFDFHRDRAAIVGESADQLTDRDQYFGRFDSIRAPFDAFAREHPLHLFFGLGVGNVTSTFGDRKYEVVERELGARQTTISILIWESGLLGMGFFIAFLLLVLRDSFALARSSSSAEIGAAWSGVGSVVLLVCYYQSIFNLQEVLAPFIYFSGVVVAKLAVERRRTAVLDPLYN